MRPRLPGRGRTGEEAWWGEEALPVAAAAAVETAGREGGHRNHKLQPSNLVKPS